MRQSLVMQPLLRVLWRQLRHRGLFTDDVLQFRDEINNEPTVRFERLEQRLPPLPQIRFGVAQKRAMTPKLDASAVQAQIERIRTALGRIKTINTKASVVRSGADDIQQEAEALRDDVKDALSDLEECLGLKPSQMTSAA